MCRKILLSGQGDNETQKQVEGTISRTNRKGPGGQEQRQRRMMIATKTTRDLVPRTTETTRKLRRRLSDAAKT